MRIAVIHKNLDDGAKSARILGAAGHETFLVEAHSPASALSEILLENVDVVFNSISETFSGMSASVLALLKEYKIPFVGSDPKFIIEGVSSKTSSSKLKFYGLGVSENYNDSSAPFKYEILVVGEYPKLDCFISSEGSRYYEVGETLESLTSNVFRALDYHGCGTFRFDESLDLVSSSTDFDLSKLDIINLIAKGKNLTSVIEHLLDISKKRYSECY